MIKFYAIYDENKNIVETFSSINAHLKTKEQFKKAKEISIDELKKFNTRKETIVLKEPTLLEQLEQLESETGYNRLTRDLCFSLKKLGGSINQTVYKKMLEIETLAKKYRKQLKNEQQKINGDLED